MDFRTRGQLDVEQGDKRVSIFDKQYGAAKRQRGGYDDTLGQVCVYACVCLYVWWQRHPSPTGFLLGTVLLTGAHDYSQGLHRKDSATAFVECEDPGQVLLNEGG